MGGAPPNHTWSVTLGWGRGTPAVINKRVSPAQLRRGRGTWRSLADLKPESSGNTQALNIAEDQHFLRKKRIA